jgi:citrate lyase subunit beta/citryl-CoA lyase
VLYVPANNERALGKIASLDCDAVIVDLEDSVAPDGKEAARQACARWFSSRPMDREYILRINALSSPWGSDDLAAAVRCAPDAVLLPKADKPQDIRAIEAGLRDLGAPDNLRLWAMIETPAGICNARAIAETAHAPGSRLDCFVAGTNDLAKETGTALSPGRTYLVPWLMEIVLSARYGGLDALDGVLNEFRDAGAIAAECRQGREMGFDGKTLIHPAQIEAANAAFGVSGDREADARLIVDTFDKPENRGKGVIRIDGRMVELLHLEQAKKTLEKVRAQRARSKGNP